jgi:hypothetical protein
VTDAKGSTERLDSLSEADRSPVFLVPKIVTVRSADLVDLWLDIRSVEVFRDPLTDAKRSTESLDFLRVSVRSAPVSLVLLNNDIYIVNLLESVGAATLVEICLEFLNETECSTNRREFSPNVLLFTDTVLIFLTNAKRSAYLLESLADTIRSGEILVKTLTDAITSVDLLDCILDVSRSAEIFL